jgi:uncharacterized coiled-coil protein SlyX
MEHKVITKEDKIQTKAIENLQGDVCEHGKTLTTIQITLDRMEQKLDPIAKNYEVATKMGKWVLASLVFLATLGTVIFTWGKIIKK